LSTQVPANPTGTVTVSGSNGAVTLMLPPGVVQVGGQNVAVTLGINPATPPAKSSSSGVGIKAFEITMKTPDGQAVTQLSQPMRIQFPYDDQQLAANGIDATSLLISSSSDGGNTWQDLTTGVDTVKHIAFADGSH